MLGRRALIAEDEPALADALTRHLQAAGLAVDVVRGVAEAEAALLGASYDLLVLDLGLVDGDGFAVLRGLRARAQTLPVLVASARADVALRVKLLEAGADDYLVKPFAAAELIARLRALLRRPRALEPQLLEAGAAVLDPASGVLRVGDASQALGQREARALAALMRRRGQLVPREVLEGATYAGDADVTPNALEGVLSRLRRRLDGLGAGVTVLSMRGLGYLLAERTDRTP